MTLSRDASRAAGGAKENHLGGVKHNISGAMTDNPIADMAETSAETPLQTLGIYARIREGKCADPTATTSEFLRILGGKIACITPGYNALRNWDPAGGYSYLLPSEMCFRR